ncbi:MAG: anhydro-N-acetylmuramic acid kinase [Thermoguttaceae bacterium]|jgi:anhydro-N-acetylmuramic acid kinase
MLKRFRVDGPQVRTTRRWTVGILVSSDCRRLGASLVCATGQGLQLQAELVKALTYPIPTETAVLFDSLDGGGPAAAETAAPGRITALRAQLAHLEAILIGDLLAEAGLAPVHVLAVGVHDPGLWNCGKVAPGYLGLCDAARLAELTGLNVIDAFPARDVAAGGIGGPITALADWLMLKDASRSRLLIDVGPTLRMTYLPANGGTSATTRLLAFDVGPGMRLVDLLAQRLTAGEQRIDAGGRLAVQGVQIPELIEHWLNDPYFRTPLPRWHPRGVRPERFLADALHLALEHGWSVRDLLCTATHFLAELVARTIARRLPEDLQFDEVILTGGGQQNGMLLREIGARLPGMPLKRIAEFGTAGETLGPASVAVLSLLHMDQVPGNPPTVTGTETSRVLGSLTPGSPQSWQRMLEALSSSRPAVQPLRSAL